MARRFPPLSFPPSLLSGPPICRSSYGRMGQGCDTRANAKAGVGLGIVHDILPPFLLFIFVLAWPVVWRSQGRQHRRALKVLVLASRSFFFPPPFPLSRIEKLSGFPTGIYVNAEASEFLFPFSLPFPISCPLGARARLLASRRIHRVA